MNKLLIFCFILLCPLVYGQSNVGNILSPYNSIGRESPNNPGFISAPAYVNSEVASWVTRVSAAGSSVSPASAAAHDTFVTSLKTAGVWSQISRLNTFGANTLAGALVPLVNTLGSATDTNHNFISTDFTLATGLASGGSTKYLDTGVIPPSPDGHLSCTSTNTSIGGPFPTFMGEVSSDFCTLVPPTSSSLFASFNYGTNGNVVATTTSNSGGFFLGSKSGTARTIYRNAANIGSNNTGGTAVGTVTITVFARGDTPSNTTSPGPFIQYSIGLALTSTQVTSYYNALTVLMTALGRTIPL